MYAIDLGKLDGVKQIFRREPENWLGSDDEESEDEDEGSTDDDEDDSEEDAMHIDEKPLYSESKRKPKEKVTVDATGDEAPEIGAASSVEETTEDSETENPQDNRPHPRPFESRKDFFQRTGNEWQEFLMTSLRWNGIQPETLSVKEIKTRAFEMSEEKWWDCREEVTALEDEQEAAGIGEVVTLADRGEASGGIGRRR